MKNYGSRSKLGAMDAKLRVIASEAKQRDSAFSTADYTGKYRPRIRLAEWLPSQEKLEAYLQTAFGPNFEIDEWALSWDQVEAFSRTDLGKGANRSHWWPYFGGARVFKISIQPPHQMPDL